MSTQNISRRQALKAILAAAGGLSAAAFIPSRWLKPLVSVGVLPAHAATSAHKIAGQSSSPGSIIVYVYNPVGVVSVLGTGFGAGVLPVPLGAPVPGVWVTLVNAVTVPQYIPTSTLGGVSITPYGSYSPQPTAKSDANGEADFGVLSLNTDSGSFTSVTLYFHADGCTPDPLPMVVKLSD